MKQVNKKIIDKWIEKGQPFVIEHHLGCELEIPHKFYRYASKRIYRLGNTYYLICFPYYKDDHLIALKDRFFVQKDISYTNNENETKALAVFRKQGFKDFLSYDDIFELNSTEVATMLLDSLN